MTYFETRFTPDDRRAPVWQHLVRYLSRWIPAQSDVLEIGAGYCDFSNAVVARTRTAVDLDAGITGHAASGVRAVVGDCRELALDDAAYDVVFASNLLEHLDRPGLEATLAEIRRVLRPGGRVTWYSRTSVCALVNTSTTTPTCRSSPIGRCPTYSKPVASVVSTSRPGSCPSR
jgi:ubiquinone/menaquinone biosynthesis C-methylase UbiE